MIINNIELILIGVINLSLFLISAVAKSECDTIIFSPKKAWFQSEYWLSKKDITERSWLFKYPLSFLWDGWHLMDSTRNTCLVGVLLVPYLVIFNVAWYWIILLIIGLYMFYGTLFELFYQN